MTFEFNKEVISELMHIFLISPDHFLRESKSVTLEWDINFLTFVWEMVFNIVQTLIDLSGISDIHLQNVHSIWAFFPQPVCTLTAISKATCKILLLLKRPGVWLNYDQNLK